MRRSRFRPLAAVGRVAGLGRTVRSAVCTPLNREKFARFRKLKRAWASFCLLTGIFLVSLLSEVIASGRPWVVRYEGRWFFPRLSLVTRDVFFEDAGRTEADFRSLADSELFAEDSGNWMLWSPVRYGPRDTLSAEEIDLDSRVEVSRRRVQRVSDARFNARGAMRGRHGDRLVFPRRATRTFRKRCARPWRFGLTTGPPREWRSPRPMDDLSGRFPRTSPGRAPRARCG